ncbi:HTH-type transcriptional regulator CysL [compost metagenome]
MDTHTLDTLPFRDDPLVLIMPPGHPLAAGEPPGFSDTLQHHYVGLSANSALAVYLEEQALHTGLRMQIRIRADGFDGVMRMVAHGAGLAIVPLAALRRWSVDQPLTSFALKEQWAQRKLLLCARSFEHLPVYARALLEALRTANHSASP